MIAMMVRSKLLIVVALVAVAAAHDPSAVDVLQDIYSTCLKDLSLKCAKPKALHWISKVVDKEQIRITQDLVLLKKDNPAEVEVGRGLEEDIFEKFEDFLQTHELVAKPPAILNPNGPLGSLVPRSFQPEELKVPLAVTGRSSKIVKKVILPFLLGLKFKTAVLVPLALALIALKTWKALTLGLLSLVLTGALLIFKLTKPKAVNYEVIHYPQHVDHHVLDHHVLDHHVVDHPPVSSGWEHPGYGRELNAQEMAYNAYSAELPSTNAAGCGSVVSVVLSDPSAVDVAQDIYKSCLQHFSVSCAKPKALLWWNNVSNKGSIKLTEDLILLKNGHHEQVRGFENENILDRFDNFLQGYNLLAKVPSVLKSDGPLTSMVPRSFVEAEPIQVPLSATGRSSKIVKKVIFPFLLGLKFNTAVLVPLALVLIALKTWKALTLGLISVVLTGAVAIFSKFVKPPQYEVVHYPHLDSHHIDFITPQLVPQPVPVVAPAPVYGSPIYRHKRDAAAQLAYRGQN
ncbi:hypothetical protein HUJ04_001778 [Dendroctonus ponderosae]|nr:hypothetical protein HUJ04_001778 [Dendroctonus ponderosae]KAH1017408.1 hypothetical protein HUJ05_008053 [Dendroctonus ponderosae]